MSKQLNNIYQKIGKNRNSFVIAYVTSDRAGLPSNRTCINNSAINYFGNILDNAKTNNKITLILHTNGGEVQAARSIINLIMEYCSELEIIVPRKSLSAGTVMCLGANKIFLSKKATLGPIDPSLSNIFSPSKKINNMEYPIPISVESVKGYFDLACKELKINDQKSLKDIFTNLVDKVHPILMGDIYKSQKQIRMIADKMLNKSQPKMNKKNKKKIINFLCSESGSHDYAIYYSEAKNLGLSVELITGELENLIEEWYSIISKELELTDEFNIYTIMTNKKETYDYCLPCVRLDSKLKKFNYVIEGKLIKQQIINMPNNIYMTQINNNLNNPRLEIHNEVSFEGWKEIKDDKN